MLDFLKIYYIDNTYENKEIRDLSTLSRYFIASSYFLIDAIYPASFVCLYFFHKAELIENSEIDLDYECFPQVFSTVKAGIVSWYQYGLLYTGFHCVTLFIWLYQTKLGLMDCLFWSVIFGIPHAFYPILLACNISHVITIFNARFSVFKEGNQINDNNLCLLLQFFNSNFFQVCAMASSNVRTKCGIPFNVLEMKQII